MLVRNHEEKGDITAYQPSPQNFDERPHIPSLEQHDPHVGVQTKPVVPPQVPSMVSTPVSQAGGALDVAV